MAAAFFAAASPLMADGHFLSAPEAEARMAAKEVTLIDIRSRAEWEETGIAKGALPISMHEQDFGQKMQALLANTPPDQVAIICATGTRTAYVIEFLEKNGVSGIQDLSEGMMGNKRGPGWLARNMPVVTLADAEKLLNAKIGK